MYNPLPIQRPARSRTTTSLMAGKGMNLRTLPQLLKADYAQLIKNYIITGDGGLEKRKGLEELFDASSSNAITMLRKWTDDVYLFGYSTTLAAYRISTDTVTDIKTNFVNSDMDGEKYGDYFFVASSGDNIGRVSFTLDYDGQTGNFATGLVVTGGTSGATAVILEDSDAGATGTLTLGNISGTFQNNEAITDTGTGAAVVNGTLDFTFTSISAAPKARKLKVIENRLFAGDLEDNRSAVKYCDVDDGSNPPFTTWTVGTGASQSGLISYRNAGTVRVIDNLGKNIVVGAEGGKWAFQVNAFDSAGTISKKDDLVMYRLDAGMYKAIQTEDGIFYVNTEGLWQMGSIGQDNIEYSAQEQLVSETLLGNDYFDDIDFSNADIIKDDKTNTLIILCAEDASSNNIAITYNTSLKAFAKFTGWAGSRFLNDEGDIYMGGSRTAKVWKIFEGHDDDGVDIYTEFRQELGVGELWTRKSLLGQYVQGELSPSSSLRLDFDIYDRDGRLVRDKLSLQWTPEEGLMEVTEYGSAGYGSASFGGDVDSVDTLTSFAGYKGCIRNFQRLIVDITENSKTPHTINWLSVLTKEKADIRNRQLTKN